MMSAVPLLGKNRQQEWKWQRKQESSESSEIIFFTHELLIIVWITTNNHGWRAENGAHSFEINRKHGEMNEWEEGRKEWKKMIMNELTQK